MPESMEECIRQCWDCRHLCQTTLFGHCLVIGGIHMEEQHVRSMMDCIEICQTAADFMTRRSPMAARVCEACADVCNACAKACERIGDESMMACAQKCRECAQACQEMAATREAA